jgi:hypothetical protein
MTGAAAVLRREVDVLIQTQITTLNSAKPVQVRVRQSSLRVDVRSVTAAELHRTKCI